MISNLLKFILGIILAIAVLIGGGVAAALYFINRSAIPPAKPVFANDEPAVKAQAAKSPAPGASPSPTPVASATPTPKPTKSSAKANANKPLPDGAYKARVTWPQGLSLRKEPTQDTERVGGVGFNQKVIVLEQSQDQVWQKIRLENGQQEGWVKAGNTKRADEQDDSQKPDQTDQTQQQ
ncbi:MAG: SH3 domain-containing protein [Heteroscytonema crispum UTEX LB 1556]